MSEKHQMFEIGQYAAIMNSEGRVLILRHMDGHWELPGGRINEGEDWEEALRREIREESGIIAYENLGPCEVDISDDRKKYYVLFRCKIDGRGEVNLGKDHVAFAWIAEDEIKDYSFGHPAVSIRLRRTFSIKD